MARPGPGRIDPTFRQWFAMTGQVPTAGAPFPAEYFPSYSRASYRRAWNRQVTTEERLGEGFGPRPEPWDPWFASRREYMQARRDNAKWSKTHSRQDMSKWKPEYGPAQTAAYNTAYPDAEWWKTPIIGRRRGTPAHKYYTVEIGHFMTAEEYDEEYPML